MAFFICSNCGFGSASWLGKCPDCGQWNTLKEQRDSSTKEKEVTLKLDVKPLSKVVSSAKSKKNTGIFEFDRVIGGGLLPGAVILLTGEPGVGKSTLLLQALHNLRTLYISGEESAEQVKDRAARLKVNLDQFFFSETLQVEGITEGLDELKNTIDILVIDSIQTVYSKNVDGAPGSVSQLREAANQLIIKAKKLGIPLIIIGHITKDGDIAGPKTLEHMVDTVLTFEGERVSQFRVLRAAKNRFGSTDEIGIFEMKGAGLAEVNNPLVFLDEHKEEMAGKAIAGIVEGKRPLFFEIQALASPTMLSIPRRVVKGVNYNKVLLLLAVIRKNLNLPLDKYDIYVNVVGGVDVTSPAADMGIIAAILSSIKNIPLSNRVLFLGEVGLLGEIRKIFSQDKILSEAERLKFQRVFSSATIHTVKDLARQITQG
ncbi:DNA repair protein RadA [Candidatus Roizmanbacteria bacterium]|nr:DNA repair protein RadA [Candidatus Roizmanbacteria bacterium]